jgi:hypothetical protein
MSPGRMLGVSCQSTQAMLRGGTYLCYQITGISPYAVRLHGKKETDHSAFTPEAATTAAHFAVSLLM